MEGRRGGDVELFDALFTAHWGAVERYARRRLGEAVSEDVAAEVFVIAWRRRTDVPVDALPWLYAVARRVVANQRRATARASRLVDRISAVVALQQSAGTASVDVDERIVAFAGLGSAFRRLSDADREVLGLVVWEDLDARRAAAALGCSVGAVAMRLVRARRRLRALMEEGGEE